VTTRWGRIGSEGQTKTKGFADEAAARREADRLIAEKVGKGYTER
jgi:predicted DNA-binding WGR domain protein